MFQYPIITLAGPMHALEAHLAAYRLLDEEEPGVWSLGVGKNSVSFPERELEQGRGILVRLYEAIPVPEKMFHYRISWSLRQSTKTNSSPSDIISMQSTSASLLLAMANWPWTQKWALWKGQLLII
jgi:hypothetical protein